jgi:hypothetical protein
MKRSSPLLAVSVMVATVAMSWLPRPAQACIPLPNASGLTDMESRRAVIWIHPQTFDIMFQNRYTGNAQDFAWVIPLPGVPTAVGQPSDNFFEDLDRFTSPMFEDRSCTIPCPSYNADGGISGEVNIVPPEVTIWGSGKLGDLEYVVISSTTSADLVAWLKAHNYSLPVELEPLVDDYLSKGYTFFAAKIAAGAAQPAAVPVVKFTFDRSKTPISYPMRISAYNRQTPLPTLLWVIAEDGTYLPSNYPHEAMTGQESTKKDYLTALDGVFAKNSGITFAVEFASNLSNSSSDSPDWKREMLYYGYGSSAATEMNEIINAVTCPYVVRLYANLNPMGTNADLILIKSSTPVQVDGWYLSPCPGGLTKAQCDGGPQGNKSDGPVAHVDGGPQGNKSDGPVAHVDGGANPPAALNKDSDSGCQLAPQEALSSGSLLFAMALVALLLRSRRQR